MRSKLPLSVRYRRSGVRAHRAGQLFQSGQAAHVFGSGGFSHSPVTAETRPILVAVVVAASAAPWVSWA